METPRYMMTQAPTAAQIETVAGSSGLSIPARNAANHATGWLMDGLLYVSQTDTARSGTGRLIEYRVPNNEEILFWIHVATVGSGVHTITLTAGTGVPTVITLSDSAPQSYWGAAPWNVVDAGWQEVSFALVDCTIDAISIWAVPRQSMTEVGGDDCIEIGDPVNLQGGLSEGQVVMTDGAADYNISGIAETLEEAYDLSRPTAIQSCAMSTTQSMAGAGIGAWGQVNVIGPFWQHRAQQWRDPAVVTTQQYRCYARIYSALGGNCGWRFRATAGPSIAAYGPAAVPAGAGAAAWTVVDGLQINSLADDTIYFEGEAVGGETLYVTDLTVKRYTP